MSNGVKNTDKSCFFTKAVVFLADFERDIREFMTNQITGERLKKAIIQHIRLLAGANMLNPLIPNYRSVSPRLILTALQACFGQDLGGNLFY